MSSGMPAAPITPSPPASETAAASGARETGLIPAPMIGCSICSSQMRVVTEPMLFLFVAAARFVVTDRGRSRRGRA